MISRKFIALAVVTISLSSGVGITAFAIDHPAAQSASTPRSDVALNDRVETLLRTDIGLAGSRFRIST